MHGIEREGAAPPRAPWSRIVGLVGLAGVLAGGLGLSSGVLAQDVASEEVPPPEVLPSETETAAEGEDDAGLATEPPPPPLPRTPGDAAAGDAVPVDAAPVIVAPPPEETVAAHAEPPLLGVGPAMPPSTDPGMMPPLRPAARPRPYVEIHGYAALWLTLGTDAAAPQHATDTFRLRWAVVRLDAHPHPDVHVLVRLGFMVENPLLDLTVSWTALPFLNVTFGQFRLPFGAAATTLAPQLNMLDRPGYAYAMTKASFRDIGLMVGTGEEGLAGGVVHYRLAVTAGNGRLLIGDPTLIRDARDLLWVGRVLLDAGPLIAPRTRLALGGTLAWTRDAAIDGADPVLARASAANQLGRVWTPFDRERETLLGGADLTFTHAGFFAQAEWMWLESRATDGSALRRSSAGSLELAYTLPFEVEGVTFQPALRGELVDPDLDRDADAYAIGSLGLNVMPFPFLRFSAFGQATFYRDAMGLDAVGGEGTLRGTTSF